MGGSPLWMGSLGGWQVGVGAESGFSYNPGKLKCREFTLPEVELCGLLGSWLGASDTYGFRGSGRG